MIESPLAHPGVMLPDWQNCERLVLLAAVGALDARWLIRQRFNGLGLMEGQDWWSVV
jgi:hypothetical protein